MLTLLLAVGSAAASPGYPAEVEAYLGAPCTPQCTICHQDNGGGDGTVVQPFGEAMMAAGLTGGSNYDALHTALDQLAADGTDSSGSGTSDIDALTAGLDPNTGNSFCGIDPPTYGCATTGGARALWPTIAGLLGAVGAVWRGRRGR